MNNYNFESLIFKFILLLFFEFGLLLFDEVNVFFFVFLVVCEFLCGRIFGRLFLLFILAPLAIKLIGLNRTVATLAIFLGQDTSSGFAIERF